MKLQKLLSYTRQAVDAYHMIQSGDKICVGISGGKDSLTLLHALKGLQRFYPEPFELHAITVKLGFEPFDLSEVGRLCESLDVPYTIVESQIGQIIFEERKEKNPCSLCAKMRKGALNEAAQALGCNKVAYGHHKEDIIETMLLSLFYEGRFYSFPPVTYMDRSELHTIRPLMYVPESDIISFKNFMNLPVVKSPCPANGHTKRESMKQMLHQWKKDYPGVTERFYHAIESGNIPGWDYRIK